MRWHELVIHTTEEATESISYFLQQKGAGGVSIEESGSLEKNRDSHYGELYTQPLNELKLGDAVIKAYFAIDASAEPLMTLASGQEMERLQLDVQDFVMNLKQFGLDPGLATVNVTQVDDEDWAHAWKQYFKPVRVTRQLTIKPSWESYVASPEEKVIELDPGMAFGTGTHATTLLCLQLMEQYVEKGMHVLDVGTGSGILAIAAVKLGADQVLALDLDPLAVSVAKQNISDNQLDEKIEVKQSDLLQAMSNGQPKAMIVANILAEIILQFVDQVAEHLADGGIYICSGIIGSKAEEVEEALKDNGLIVIQRADQDGWAAFAAQKAGELS